MIVSQSPWHMLYVFILWLAQLAARAWAQLWPTPFVVMPPSDSKPRAWDQEGCVARMGNTVRRDYYNAVASTSTLQRTTTIRDGNIHLRDQQLFEKRTAIPF
jgi:hypothetical protein